MSDPSRAASPLWAGEWRATGFDKDTGEVE